MNINLHIERLVLDGVPMSHLDGPLVQDALQAELTRLFAQSYFQPNLLSAAAVPMLRADNIDLGLPVAPRPFGQQIAQAVHGIIVK